MKFFNIKSLAFSLFLIPATVFANLATLSLTGKCDGCDLSNSQYDLANFSGKKFYCSNFNNASFQNADFSNGIIAGKLTRTNMRGADLSSITLEAAANWQNCLPPSLGISFDDLSLSLEMTHGTLGEPMFEIDGILFLDSDLRGSTLNGSKFITPEFHTNFKKSGVIGILATKLTGVRAKGSSTDGGLMFISSDAKKIDFSGLRFAGDSLHPKLSYFFVISSDWAGANVSRSQLPLYLESSKFTNSNLSESKISYVFDSDLSNSSLRNSDLRKSTLKNSSFNNNDFSDANLSGANMSGSSFKGASFVGANLAGANLSNADFSDADFTNANLEDVNLQGTNLCEATGPDGNLLFIGC